MVCYIVRRLVHGVGANCVASPHITNTHPVEEQQSSETFYFANTLMNMSSLSLLRFSEVMASRRLRYHSYKWRSAKS